MESYIQTGEVWIGIGAFVTAIALLIVISYRVGAREWIHCQETIPDASDMPSEPSAGEKILAGLHTTVWPAILAGIVVALMIALGMLQPPPT